MKLVNKIRIYVIFLCLLSITLINYNIVANIHVHLYESGQFGFHTHPYSKGNDDLPLSPKHNHTKIELLYLTQIINTFSFSIIILLISFLLIPRKKKCSYNPHYRIPLLSVYLFPLRRGPPTFHPSI